MTTIFQMSFSSIYSLYLQKVTRKGRTKAELDAVIEWLTGYDTSLLQQLLDKNVTLAAFFGQAKLHANAHLITGVICGYRVEDIEDEQMRKVRYLDKLVDELAKGKTMDKIMRK